MLYSYKSSSKSAQALKNALGIKMIKLEGSNFKGNPDKIVINWGASQVSDEVKKCQILNEPEAVKIASNKLTFFEKVKGEVSIPEFTVEKGLANKWIQEGEVVVVRELLNSSAAKGVNLLENEKEFDLYPHEKAKLYVKYIPKKQEYRVHIVNGEVIDIRRKALRNDFPKGFVNWKIRNHAGGFIFQKNGFETPKEVVEEAVKAIVYSGLNFGGVDIIWNNFRNKAYVLEVNTAPGLEGSSVDNYAKAFKKIYNKDFPFKPMSDLQKKINKPLFSFES